MGCPWALHLFVQLQKAKVDVVASASFGQPANWGENNMSKQTHFIQSAAAQIRQQQLIDTNQSPGIYTAYTHGASSRTARAVYIYRERDRVEEKKNLDGLITDARNMPPEESSKHRLLGRKRPAPCSLAVGRCQLVNLSASTAPSGKFVRVDPKKNLQHGSK